MTPSLAEPIAIEEPQRHGDEDQDNLVNRARQWQESERTAPTQRLWNAFVANQERSRTECAAEKSAYSSHAISLGRQRGGEGRGSRRNAGLPHVRLHDLRHGAATLALESAVNLEMIRHRTGHARISTTIDLYARHEIESSERAAADRGRSDRLAFARRWQGEAPQA